MTDSLYQNRNWLYDQYITQKKSGRKIAKEINVCNHTIYKWLDILNIPKRTHKESLKISTHPILGKNRPKDGNIIKSLSLKGEKNRNWKGGRINHDGYILIYKPEHPNTTGIYVGEHILVMEEELNRYLTIDEVIHHINGIKDDNKIENLYLAKNRSKHRKAHSSINKLLKSLLDKGIIGFNKEKGEYYEKG